MEDNHSREVDVGELLENCPMRRFQWLTLILGCLMSADLAETERTKAVGREWTTATST